MKSIKRIIRLLASGRSAKKTRVDAPISPDCAFYVIGDIHGRLDLLEALLRKIENENPGAQIICVGDYVDRGEQGRDVLNFLYSNSQKLHCLMGNHEEMMLDFLDAPELHGMRWLRNGGLQTLASYGIRGIFENTSGAALICARDGMHALIGEAQVAWLRSLPRYWQSGNVAVVHAGADPGKPMHQQQDSHLTWGHADFLAVPRYDGVWVIHGHTIVTEPLAQNGRIAIDTGAYATGRLTAAHITPDGIRFLTA